ncbi:hypothetical protein EMIT093MI4_90098 [Pseudomonas sp. IT-93MI4]
MHQQLHRYREQAHSYRGPYFNCRSEPARDGHDSVSLKKTQKKRSPKAPLFFMQPA